MQTKLKKWNEAYQDADISTATAAQVLTNNAFLLPKKGKALDLACGRAGNAIFLAKKGFDVDAIDISTVVLEQVQHYANQQNLSIHCIEQDIEADGLESREYKKYDVIVVSYFLNRQLFPQIIKALKPNGLLFYQTWSQENVDDAKGPKNPAFRLTAGELLRCCSELQILYYSENGVIGDISQGIRNEALIIARQKSI